jgi:polyisoprenoid-binding protein YceI
MRRRNALTLLAGLAALPALGGLARAAPVRYGLDTAGSRVGFEVDFGPDRITGEMPVRGARILLDLRRLADSRVDVVLDAAGARASFPFATQAMLGPRVLDAANHPEIRFESRRVTGSVPRGEIEGLVTIRGVTRPVTLSAQLYRQHGTPADETARLEIHLRGSVRRSEFGADGWSDMVGDEVRLTIVARIEREG